MLINFLINFFDITCIHLETPSPMQKYVSCDALLMLSMIKTIPISALILLVCFTPLFSLPLRTAPWINYLTLITTTTDPIILVYLLASTIVAT